MGEYGAVIVRDQGSAISTLKGIKDQGLVIRHLGQVEYEPTWRAMQAFTAARTIDTPDEFWVLEHPPVYTQGQAGKPEHLLRATDIPVIRIDRGGQITYHGPGQLVLYTLIDLRRRGYGIRELVQRMEQGVIDMLAALGVVGERISGAPLSAAPITLSSSSSSSTSSSTSARASGVARRKPRWAPWSSLSNVTTMTSTSTSSLSSTSSGGVRLALLMTCVEVLVRYDDDVEHSADLVSKLLYTFFVKKIQKKKHMIELIIIFLKRGSLLLTTRRICVTLARHTVSQNVNVVD